MKGKEGLKVTIESFSHATEDESKVMKAMMNLISLDKVRPKIKTLFGHWKNPILLIEYEIFNEEAKLFMKSLSQRLKEVDKEKILNNLEERIDDKGRIHLRFDKQKAYKGEIETSSSDDIIKVIISSYQGRKEAIRLLKENLG